LERDETSVVPQNIDLKLIIVATSLQTKANKVQMSCSFKGSSAKLDLK